MVPTRDFAITEASAVASFGHLLSAPPKEKQMMLSGAKSRTNRQQLFQSVGTAWGDFLSTVFDAHTGGKCLLQKLAVKVCCHIALCVVNPVKRQWPTTHSNSCKQACTANICNKKNTRFAGFAHIITFEVPDLHMQVAC